jgi:hypothetical protein
LRTPSGRKAVPLPRRASGMPDRADEMTGCTRIALANGQHRSIGFTALCAGQFWRMWL